MYELQQKVLLRKFQTTTNQSLDGLSDLLPRWKMSEFGSLDLFEQDFGEEEKRADSSMPGVTKGDLSNRNIKPVARYALLLRSI